MQQLFNKQIYDSECLRKAAEDFSTIAEISLQDNDKNWICIFSRCLNNDELTVKEYSNYVLDLMNNK